MSAKILVVDDEVDLVRLVRYNLERAGFEVICAYDGREALALTWREQPDLIVLDVMLPDKSGYEICREIKRVQNAQKPIPVLMLTARSTEQDRIHGFESGGDDYVTKPFSPRELVLRIRAMLGRPWLQAQEAQTPQTLTVGRLVIRPDAHQVLIEEPDGRQIDVILTKLEFRILCALARTPNMAKNREQLLSEVWEQDAEEVLDRTVDAHMKRLRGKLGSARSQLETIRGVGYRLNA